MLQRLNVTLSIPSLVINKRDDYVDMSKAIGILLMVIGHNEFAYWFGGLPRVLIYSFHMPLFFLLSGYMHKQKDIAATIRRGAQTLLYPYFTFGVTSLLIKILLRNYPILTAIKVLLSVNSSIGHSVWFADGYTIGPIWFLVSLFWGKVIFTIVFKYCSRYHFIISLAISFCSINLVKVCNLPLGILTGLSSVVFISIGYHFREKGINLWLLFLTPFIWLYSLKYPMDMANLYYTNYFMNIIGAVGGTVICFILSILLYRIPIINRFVFWGHYSIQVLCWHYIIIALFPYEVVTGKLYCTLFVLAPFIITYYTAKFKIFDFMFSSKRFLKNGKITHIDSNTNLQ